MIRLFETLKGKLAAQGSHPLANPKEADSVFEDLRGEEPLKALEEVTHWLESVTHDDEIRPERRFELIKRLDEIAQPHRIKVGRDYGNLSRQSRFQEGKLWTAKHDFWFRTSAAYTDLIERFERKDKGTEGMKTQPGLIALRALRAASRRLKWLYVRYGPVPNDIWATLAQAYQFAEARRVHNLRATIYPGIPGDSTPEEEFMRAMLLAASAPDALTPPEMDVCERIIAHYAGRFRISTQPQPESTYWFDLAQPKQPLRLAAPPTQRTPGLRFFATAAVHVEVQAMLTKLEQANELPAGVDFGGTPEPRLVREVLKHLALNWAPKPPVRKSERKRLQTRMSVAHGLPHLIELVRASEVDFPLDTAVTETETWVVENVSSGGFGATVAQPKGDWLKIGTLLAVQPDAPPGASGHWDIALVRRLSRESAVDAKAQASAGVQILSRTAVCASLVNAGGVWAGGLAAMDGLYLADSGQPGTALLVLPQGVYLPGEQITTMIAGVKHLLFPVAMVERGDDYDLISFRDMVQED